MEKRPLGSRAWSLFGIASVLLFSGTAAAQVWERIGVQMVRIGSSGQLFKAPKPVTAQVRKEAIEYVELMETGGGTSIDGALTAALAAQVEGSQPRVVLFFTDGQSAAQPALEAASKDKHDVRLFTVGIGKEIDRALLSRLEALKRGRFTYIPVAANMESEVARCFPRSNLPCSPMCRWRARTVG